MNMDCTFGTLKIVENTKRTFIQLAKNKKSCIKIIYLTLKARFRAANFSCAESNAIKD